MRLSRNGRDFEEIAYRRGFINKEQLLKLAEPLMKTDYGKYIKEVAEGL